MKGKKNKHRVKHYDSEWVMLPVLKDVFRKEFKKDSDGNILARNVYLKTRISQEAFLLDGIGKVEDNYNTVTGARAAQSSLIYYATTRTYHKIAIPKMELIKELIGAEEREQIGFKAKTNGPKTNRQKRFNNQK